MGEPDPAKLIDRMGDDARLLAVWRAYWRREPFGYFRHNMHAILTASAFSKDMPPVDSLLIRDNTPEFDELFEEHKARRKAQKAEECPPESPGSTS